MRSHPTYRDRGEAGKILAAHVLAQIGTPENSVVLALPRGGLPVGLEVARAIGAPLDVFVVRKIGAPGFEEYAIGAIASGRFQVLNNEAIRQLDISADEIAAMIKQETVELHRREQLYRVDQSPLNVTDRIVVLVDDGLATGFTMRAALAAMRESRPQRVVVAVPVGAVDTCREIEHEADTLICPLQPEPFQAVGLWYRDFTPTSDEEVRDCLAAAAQNYELSHRGSGA